MSSEYEESIGAITEHIYGTWRSQDRWKKPTFVDRAEGVYFYDDEGKRFLDFSSQLMCSNLGHGNEAIIEAIKKQASEMPYIAPGFASRIKAEAAEALKEVTPDGLDKFFFSTSGTEANEAAVKMLRQFKEPAYKIISRYRSYHGSTAASISLTGDPRREFAERAKDTVPGVVFAPDNHCYRCPFELDYPGCGIQCAEYVDYMIKEEGNVAALFLEPVVGTNGKLVPVDEYLPRLRKICDENDVLLVADEVMSGWFRSGEWFAVDNWEITPDILTTAKGATGAYTPLGITATSEEIAEYFEDETMCHGHTYAMHPLALAAIPPAVKEYRKLMDSGRPQQVSDHIENELKSLKRTHPSIGDIRGIGHFWGIEIVKDPETKEPFNTRADKFDESTLTGQISAEAMKKGLYVFSAYDHFTVAPPLTITKEQVDEGIDILDEVLKIADEKAAS